jgi:cytochrome c oxidase assembly factor CtaG
MALALGGGYHGPPELTVARAFTEWTLDPWMLALVAVLGGCYLAGVRHLRRQGVGWPLTRSVNFLGLGLGILVIATMSSLRTYYGVLFYMRSFQTILLLLLAPLFLALGRPITLATRVFPTAGRRIERGIRGRLARTLTFPAITTLSLVAVPFVMYFTAWYTAGFHSATVRELTYLALMTPGYVFFWTLLRVDPVPKEYSYGVSLWITAVEVIGDAFLGLAVIASTSLIGAAYYHAVARPWGPTLQTDQILGGGTLWIFGDLVGLPFLVAQLIQFMREDEAEAAQIDAELDARDAARARAKAMAAGVAGAAGLAGAGTGQEAAAADGSDVVDGASVDGGAKINDGAVVSGVDSGAAGEAGGGTPGPDDPDRPWWETDPRFSERFKQV